MAGVNEFTEVSGYRISLHCVTVSSLQTQIDWRRGHFVVKSKQCVMSEYEYADLH